MVQLHRRQPARVSAVIPVELRGVALNQPLLDLDDVIVPRDIVLLLRTFRRTRSSATTSRCAAAAPISRSSALVIKCACAGENGCAAASKSPNISPMENIYFFILYISFVNLLPIRRECPLFLSSVRCPAHSRRHMLFRSCPSPLTASILREIPCDRIREHREHPDRRAKAGVRRRTEQPRKDLNVTIIIPLCKCIQHQITSLSSSPHPWGVYICFPVTGKIRILS